jgi:hypothetical protein
LVWGLRIGGPPREGTDPGEVSYFAGSTTPGLPLHKFRTELAAASEESGRIADALAQRVALDQETPADEA